jgi:hypothetical protein
MRDTYTVLLLLSLYIESERQICLRLEETVRVLRKYGPLGLDPNG